MQQLVALPAFVFARGAYFIEKHIEIVSPNLESSLYIYVHSSLHRERECVRERRQRQREKEKEREIPGR